MRDQVRFLLRVDSAAHTMALIGSFDNNRLPTPIGAAIPIPNGGQFTASVVVNPPNFTLYLDGKQVFSASDNHPIANQDVQLWCQDGTGTVRLLGARVYALPQ